MSKDNSALSAIYNPLFKNVLYYFPKGSRNADKIYNLARNFYRKNIQVQQVKFPDAHKTVFKPNSIKVCIHIRRGDVGADDAFWQSI